MIDSLAKSHEAWIAGADGPVQDLRQRSMEAFETHGLPSKRVESWKYTSAAKLARTPFIHDAGVLFEALAGSVVGSNALPGAAAEIVLVNGRFSEGLSRLSGLPSGVRVRSMQAYLSEQPDLDRLETGTWPALPNAARTTLGPYRRSDSQDGQPAAKRPESAFHLLNTAFLGDGIVIEVAPDTVLRDPIHILHAMVASEEPIAAHPRLVIDVGRHASVCLVEHHVGTGDGATFANLVVDARVQASARLEHHLWHELDDTAFHVQHSRALIGRDAVLEHHVAWLRGGWGRHDLELRFTEAGASATCTGLTVADGSQHVDHHTWLRHEAPHCTSRETYKGVFAGKSRGVFNGMVHIANEAQHTNAALSNKNLLLSDRAQVQTKPELEIHADDVKAAHGCTVGQLDRAGLDYLRTRGIARPEAEGIMTIGFIIDLLDEITNERLRDVLEDRVRARLNELSGVRG